MSTMPPVSFAHLLRMSDSTGLFEHARGALPRREHGYCVDDVARGLVVLAREPRLPDELSALLERYLAFVAHAQTGSGIVHNRLGFDRRWHDSGGTGDWWGRALWGLGTVAARGHQSWVREEALICFDISASRRSRSRRSMAFAALGAAEVLAWQPDHSAARSLLTAAAELIDRPRTDPDRPTDGSDWPWPEERLYYANALLPEVLLAAGHHLGDPEMVADGLSLLRWLWRVETRSGHLSVTPNGGWGATDTRPGFDQQPIEVATLVDAFARAHAVSGDPSWLEGVELGVSWFLGDNDAGKPVMDVDTGGGFDGIGPTGPSLNQGAESTLALISTLQHGHNAEQGAM